MTSPIMFSTVNSHAFHQLSMSREPAINPPQRTWRCHTTARQTAQNTLLPLPPPSAAIAIPSRPPLTDGDLGAAPVLRGAHTWRDLRLRHGWYALAKQHVRLRCGHHLAAATNEKGGGRACRVTPRRARSHAQWRASGPSSATAQSLTIAPLHRLPRAPPWTPRTRPAQTRRGSWARAARTPKSPPPCQRCTGRWADPSTSRCPAQANWALVVTCATAIAGPRGKQNPARQWRCMLGGGKSALALLR